MKWINWWKLQEVACKKLQSKEVSADEACLDNQHKNCLPILFKKLKKNNFSMLVILDFFTNACLTRLTFLNKTCTGGKHLKDRLSVLVAASTTGKKLPLLVIAKAAKPQCFKSLKKLTL